jgi:hypothetical protein
MTMNYVEKAECLLDAGGAGNMNFTIIVSYRGEMTLEALHSALSFPQSQVTAS